MIRIIDDKPHPTVVKKTICKNCGVTIEYTPDEIKSKIVGDYGGGSDVYHFLQCPKCNHTIYVTPR